MELCGGTHVASTAEIGLFKIISESGVAAGIRRIEAVAGPAVLGYLNEREAVVKTLGDRFKAQPGEIVERVLALQDELKATGKALAAARSELAVAKAAALVNKAKNVTGTSFPFLLERVDGIEGPDLQKVAKNLQEKLGPKALVMISSVPSTGRVGIATAFGSKAVERGADADKMTKIVAKICGGGGGGSKSMAQAGGKDESALPQAVEKAKQWIQIRITTQYGDRMKQKAGYHQKPDEGGSPRKLRVRASNQGYFSKKNKTSKIAD
jgi:alanyl-tRNA synthetase